jgi:endoglucanase
MSGSEGGIFGMSEGGANGTSYAARIVGELASAHVVYAGMGVNLVDPKGPFDASAYAGIAFYARRGEGAAEKIRVSVPDLKSDPDGRICSECFNDFGMELRLTPQWQRYVLPFASMTQQPGWGSPRPSQIDQAAIFSVQFRPIEAGAPFDIWIDQLEFFGC